MLLKVAFDELGDRALGATGLSASYAEEEMAEARAIAGRRSGDIAVILGYAGRGPVVHRDDMVL